MNRVEALKELCGSYPYVKAAKMITEAEFDETVAFIEDNDNLDHLEFEYKVNRWYLDSTKKPKNIAVMSWLLVSANTRAKGKTR